MYEDDSMPIPLMFIIIFVCSVLWGCVQSGTLKGAIECGVGTVLLVGGLMIVIVIVCFLYYLLTGQL